MTAVVGVLCRDGVVIGSDSSATFAATPNLRTIEQPTDKLSIIGGRTIVASSGEFGLNQRFERIVTGADEQDLWQSKHYIEVGKMLSATAIKDFSSTGINFGQIGYSALIAFYSDGKPQLCEFSLGTFQPEFKDENIWYVSMGSGQLITDPFLALMRSIFWDDGVPTVQDAIFAVTWTLEHVISVNPGGINGPTRIAVLQEDSQQSGNFVASTLDNRVLLEHKEYIALLTREMKNHAASLHRTTNVPTIPKPKTSG